MQFPRTLVLSLFCLITLAWCLRAGLDGSTLLPLDHSAIQYSARPAHDAVTELQQQIASGKVELVYDDQHGYLPALLQHLHVPVSSQVLVFSKTSFQAPKISPRMPRALYYNDQIALGWVRGGDVLEISAVDPQQGPVFYTLDQNKTDVPRFDRRDDCLQCHQSGGTLGVPGHIVRSVFPDPTGMPIFQAGTFTTDHRSPFEQRWGGWYVTGTHGSQLHMGNVVCTQRETADLDPRQGANVTTLKSRFDTGAYLSPHSDIVSLMVLEHQTRMQNLLTRVNYETRLALHDQRVMNEAFHEPLDRVSDSTRRRIENAVESLLAYLLFTDEALLTEPVRGTSAFAAEFARQGPRDSQGRSLRDFDLQRRLFRYPCSYLIYSPAFERLPPMAKKRIYRRLWEVVSGFDQSAAYARLTSSDRQSIREILLATKAGLPSYWRDPELNVQARDK